MSREIVPRRKLDGTVACPFSSPLRLRVLQSQPLFEAEKAKIWPFSEHCGHVAPAGIISPQDHNIFKGKRVFMRDRNRRRL